MKIVYNYFKSPHKPTNEILQQNNYLNELERRHLVPLKVSSHSHKL